MMLDINPRHGETKTNMVALLICHATARVAAHSTAAAPIGHGGYTWWSWLLRACCDSARETSGQRVHVVYD
jgi:hypothetical protein